jgi:hypothetical protein
MDRGIGASARAADAARPSKLPSQHKSWSILPFHPTKLKARARESIPSLAESIPGLLKSLQIWSLASSWPLCVCSV